MTPREATLLAALREFAAEAARDEVRAALALQRPAEALLTTREVARRASAKPDTILSWIARGDLPATKPAGAKGWRVRPVDLEAFLAGASKGAEPHPIRLEERRAQAAARLAETVRRHS